ncbi:outer membrane protein [Thalassococcus sp. S3]|uniref:outer membrane protein n=1 Tax=Thalassococcus sp. S3 TaxID=2017482 RepID=UPI0010241091|nr:outer membrane beta-barrel protein [Thalassococcus sp. S3]QBF31640.1 hypothetical protein CFI11_10480 [Thalassococcus sp. S3]
MKLHRVLAGVTVLMAAPAVMAGNLVEPVPEPVPVAPAPAPVVVDTGGEWTGGYAGLQLGQLDVDGDGNADGDDVMYGLHAGYDYDFGRFVLGGEFDYDFADIDLNGAANVDNVMRLKLRAGYDLGRTLLYATAGAARVDTSIGDETGPFGGVGISYAVAPNFTVGGEVLYHEFDELGSSGVGAEATSVSLRGSFRF